METSYLTVNDGKFMPTIEQFELMNKVAKEIQEYKEQRARPPKPEEIEELNKIVCEFLMNYIYEDAWRNHDVERPGYKGMMEFWEYVEKTLVMNARKNWTNADEFEAAVMHIAIGHCNIAKKLRDDALSYTNRLWSVVWSTSSVIIPAIFQIPAPILIGTGFLLHGQGLLGTLDVLKNAALLSIDTTRVSIGALTWIVNVTARLIR